MALMRSRLTPILLFVALIGLAGGIVLVARAGGPGALSTISAQDPTAGNRVRQAGLSITLSLGESSGSGDFGSSLVEAGAYTGVAALIAGKAERAGEISASHLWLALDADARQLHALFQFEYGEAGIEDAVRVIPEFSEWRAWARLGRYRPDRIVLGLETLGEALPSFNAAP